MADRILSGVACPADGRPRHMGHSRKFIGLAILACCSCVEPANVDKPRSAMTQRERDSTVAISGLPGSRTVGQAIGISDSEARRAAALDSASR